MVNRKRKISLSVVALCLVFVVFSISAEATEYYVNAGTGSNGNGGLSPDDAWKTITYALSQVSGTGHTIHVAAGTYDTTNNGETFPISMKNGVSLMGDGADVTILDAENAAGIGVISASRMDSSTILDGFTITGGNESGYVGGGINSVTSSWTVSNCIITGNYTSGFGGGINCESTDKTTFINCTISNNSSAGGGGVECYYRSAPTFINCVFSNNQAPSGGAIMVESSGTGYGFPKFINCTITGNTVTSRGGAFYGYSGSALFTNCTIAGNSAATGSALCGINSLSCKIVNTIIWGNTGAPYEIQSGSTSWPFSIAELSFSDYNPSNKEPRVSITTAIGNINADPLFVGGGDYHLQGTPTPSPCIDTGTDDDVTYPDIPSDDRDGDSRPQGLDYDMGSDEYAEAGPSCVDNDSDGYGVCPDCGTANGCTYDGDDCNDEDDAVNPGATESCDGIDNNCDGSVDEELTRPTTCGVGACAGNMGIETCTAGTWGSNTCDPLGGAASETCDGLDNDCDGMVDNDDPGGGGSCNTGLPGICSAGTEHCQGAAIQCIQDQSAITEICDDGLDNDCDGFTDASDDECINVPTPPGEDVVVEPIDSTTGETPATITFENVTAFGLTNVTTGGTGAPPPSGFKLGQPPVYYEITTTATCDGSIIICIDYSGISFANENNLRLFHRKDSSWEDVTSSLDAINDIICGTVSSLSLFAIFQENMVPEVGEITAPIAPAPVDTPITVSATFTDPDTDDTHIATWDWGDETTSTGTVTESGGEGIVTGGHVYTGAGVYTVTLTVTDDDGLSDQGIYQYVVVYDPEGGFVTGGGWIESSAGAYVLNFDLTGKANFGFVSKYKKGATVPTGVTEFQFKVADLNFYSDSYEWLVVAGAKAQYKGVGTINGEGQYRFLLTALDADISETDAFLVDRFRIKIWSEDDYSVETIVYDNGLGDADAEDSTTTELSGGSIVIHTK